MSDKSLFGLGLAGMVIAVVCCIGPALLIATGLISVSVLTGTTIYVLTPLLVLFVAVVGYDLWRRWPPSHNGKH
ncbi:hypothetical protein [Chelativorans alearense]|uniref:hypothetical protein n=1 Tax=Chelativorans alearense TaxID=2681495 RepID=UPI0013D294AE|nr:hypothetical protein [Chelativorans alearense]